MCWYLYFHSVYHGVLVLVPLQGVHVLQGRVPGTGTRLFPVYTNRHAEDRTTGEKEKADGGRVANQGFSPNSKCDNNSNIIKPY